MDIVWITHPDNYDPLFNEQLRSQGGNRVSLFAERGFDVRFVRSFDVVAAWLDGPHLWCGDDDLLRERRGFMISGWTWDAAAAQHLRAISRTIRASDSVLLNDGIGDPEGLGADKLAMYHFAGALGVPVLPTVAIPFGRYARRALPIVRRDLPDGGYLVKPREMAMGFGVLRTDGIAALTATIDLLTPSGLGCIVQPYYDNAGDLRVYTHRGQVLAAMLRRPAPGSYLANVSQGGSTAAGTIPPDVRSMSERLARALGADYLCIDWLLADNGPIFNEWMTISALFEDLPEPERTMVADAFFQHIAGQLEG